MIDNSIPCARLSQSVEVSQLRTALMKQANNVSDESESDNEIQSQEEIIYEES